jgi:hypothetical protein
MSFQAIRQFPGEDLEGVANRIAELYGDMHVSRYLTYPDGEYLLLKSRIGELDCIEEREKRYFYNPQAEVYARDKTLNMMIKDILQSEQNTAKELRARDER